LQRSTSGRRPWPVYHCVQHGANEAARRAGPSATADTCLVTSKSLYIAITMKGHFAYNSPYSLNGFAQNSEKVRNHCGISHATQKNGIQGFRQTAPKSGRTHCFFSVDTATRHLLSSTDFDYTWNNRCASVSRFVFTYKIQISALGILQAPRLQKNETPFLFSLCFLDSSLIS